MAYLDQASNFSKGVLASGIDSSQTSFSLQSGQGSLFPAFPGNPYNVVIWNATDYPADSADDPNKEMVRVTARTTDAFTCIRGQEGTSGVAHNTGGKTYRVALIPTKKLITDIDAAIAGTLPRSCFIAGMGSNQAVTKDVLTLLQFRNNEINDLSGEYSAASDERFIASIQGYFCFEVQVYTTSTVGGTVWELDLYRNGAQLAATRNTVPGSGAREFTQYLSRVVRLGAGDIVDARVVAEVGGSGTVTISNAVARTYFTGMVVGVGDRV